MVNPGITHSGPPVMALLSFWAWDTWFSPDWRYRPEKLCLISIEMVFWGFLGSAWRSRIQVTRVAFCQIAVAWRTVTQGLRPGGGAQEGFGFFGEFLAHPGLHHDAGFAPPLAPPRGDDRLLKSRGMVAERRLNTCSLWERGERQPSPTCLQRKSTPETPVPSANC